MSVHELELLISVPVLRAQVQYCSTDGALSRTQIGRKYLWADRAPLTGLVVEDEEAVLLLAFWRGAREDARYGGAAPEERGVAREVDVRVDVDEQAVCSGHGG